MGRIYQFDGLRGILAIWVILFHLDSTMVNEAIANNYIVELGVLAVDVFFGLSGFVIFLNYRQTKLSFSSFMEKRLKRLYPMMFFSTTLYLSFYLLKHLINGSSPELQLFIDYFRSVFLINSTNFFTSENYLGLNFPSWSVSVEVILYAIFGFVVLVTKRLDMFKTMFVISLFCIIILGYNNVFFEPGFGVWRGTLSFSVGMITAHLDIRKNNRFKQLHEKFLMRWVNMIAIIFLLLMIHESEIDGLNIIYVPLLVFLSLQGVLYSCGWLYTILISEPFQFLGKISYSMYLNHALFLAIIPFLYFEYFKFPVNQFTLFISGGSILFATILWSQFTHKYIENIFRKRK